MKEKLTNLYKKIYVFVFKRKLLSVIILITLTIFVYKIFFSSTPKTQIIYSVDKVSRETIVSYVSETGQVMSNGSIDIKSSVSGKINSLKFSPGDDVKAGQVIATIESTNAYTSLESARLSYENAKVSYKKATSPASMSSILTVKNNLQNSSSSLVKSYIDALNSISLSYSDMSTVISYLHDALYLSDINSSQYNMFYYADTERAIENMYSLVPNANTYLSDVNTKFNLIKSNYDSAFVSYQALSNSSTPEELRNSLEKTSVITGELSNAIKSAINLIQYYQDLNNKYSLIVNPKSTTYLNNLKSYQNTINSDMASLNSVKTNIDSLKLSILQQQINLNDLENGASGLDLESAEIALNQAKLNYNISLNNYNNYFITSPIDGKIASVSATLGGDANGVVIATIITDSKFVDVSVSENDVVKIKLGQKATITFDAIDDLSLVGTVSQINQSGTVSSGIVSYNVKIAFKDFQNQIRPGMSATANIVTGIANDVLAVPNSAIKSSISINYIDTFNSTSALTQVSLNTYTSNATPTRKTVTTGLVGDSYTEIITGLNENDFIVTKTNSGAKSTTVTIPTSGGSSRGGSSIGGIKF
ncbi:MAG: HlyD family efflux transporter periplasmic adaptor subunit [Candidatus Pacebacteria bacterium]|nr:HlyD family efflux transporter periplasmic adaptor subunit [Candidatus Paceibacterota bacterium]